MSVKIIGFVGSIGSGKDTAGLILKTENKNFNDVLLLSFAGPLKKFTSELFQLDTDSFTNRVKKETKIERFNKSPRELLQWFGSDIMRKFDDNFWINFMSLEVENIKKRAVEKNEKLLVVVTDVRFINEAEFIKANGGDIWFIDSSRRIRNQSTHISDTTMFDILKKFQHFTITNNDTIENYIDKISKITKTL